VAFTGNATFILQPSGCRASFWVTINGYVTYFVQLNHHIIPQASFVFVHWLLLIMSWSYMIIKWLFRRSVQPPMFLDLCAWFLAITPCLSALRALFSLASRCFTGHRSVHVAPLHIPFSYIRIPSSSCCRASFLTNNTSGISCHIRRFIWRAFDNSRVIAGYSLHFPRVVEIRSV